MPSSTKALVALKQERLLHRLNEPAFTPPQFYFGDRVQWTGEDANGIWASRTGQITGMHFTRLRTWHTRSALTPTLLPMPRANWT